MKTVFLGGTCNGSLWRDRLLAHLNPQVINAYNPVVEDWTPECQVEEIRQREICDFCLYVITPKMTGVYSIAEVVDDSNKRPQKVLFHFLEEDDEATFSAAQLKSLTQVGKMVEANGGQWFKSAAELLEFMELDMVLSAQHIRTDFSWALASMKEGKSIAREGWNGKGMYLYFVPAASYAAVTDAARKEFGDMVPYGAYIAMKTAQNNVVPWQPSQADMVATDWVIL